MWPFIKKNHAPVLCAEIKSSTVICIPGIWNNFDAIPDAIFSASEGNYIVVGDIIFNAKAEHFYKFEIRSRGENIIESFRALGRPTGISDGGLSKIGKHNYVIYISGSTGGVNEAHQMALTGAAVLKAGGLGIRIDTAGKAFEKEKWLKYVTNFAEPDLLEMFVSSGVIDERKNIFSRGMHNLGLKDTIISGMDFQQAVDLINVFGYYQIFDKPLILPNQIFQPDHKSPKYLISEQHDRLYDGGNLFSNPYGLWRLTRL
jgi:hypothetical protein